MKSGFTKWTGIILVAISLLSAFYIWRVQSARGLDLALDVPDQIMSGVPFDLKVNFSNNSGAILNDARLTVTLPDGVAFYGSPSGKTIEIRQIGNVGQGSLVQESFPIVAIAPEQSVKRIKVSVGYSPASLGAKFEKIANADLRVESSGIVLEMSAPEKATSGEDFETIVSYRNVSGIDFSALELKIEYPPSFTFNSASMKPDTENNIWSLGDLRKNSEGKITIRGNLTGGADDIYEFKAQISEREKGENYLVSAGSAKTAIAASPLSLTIHLNDDNGNYIAKAGDTLNYTLSYVNGTSVALHDISIKASLIGEMFDLASINAQDFSRQGDSVLIWNSGNNPNLAFVSPGSAGAVNFSVKVKDSFPVKRFSDKNYSLLLNAEISSPTPSVEGSAFLSKARLENKVSGSIIVDAKVFFRDAESGFLNKGVFPPKAGQPTQFTIHWILKSMAADISGIEVRSILGNGVKMIGGAKSNGGSLPIYNSETNEVFWQVDKLQANQGIVGGPIESVFQIEATPSADQVGTFMPLINATTIRGSDSFTGQDIVSSDVGITTALQDDSTITVQGVVQP